MAIDIRHTELGRVFTYMDLLEATMAVWGGVSWPTDERSGCVTVIGAGKQRHADGHAVSILEEFESFDVRALVNQCVALDSKYWISIPRQDQVSAPKGKWIADATHEASLHFMRESRAKFQAEYEEGKKFNLHYEKRKLQLTSTPLFEMDGVYDMLMPKIAQWVMADRQLLYLKDSQAAVYLNELDAPDGSELSGLKLGYLPAVEAFGFAAYELQRFLLRMAQGVFDGHDADMGVVGLYEV